MEIEKTNGNESPSRKKEVCVKGAGKRAAEQQFSQLVRVLDKLNPECKKCSLGQTKSSYDSPAYSQNKVDGFGPEDADILIVCESPPTNNDLSHPNPPARLAALRRAFKLAGIPHDVKIRYTGALRCTSFEINFRSCGFTFSNPAQVEQHKQCRDYLLEEIKAIKPKIVVLCGPGPLYSALGKKDMYGTKYIGSLYEKEEIYYLTTHDPYYFGEKVEQHEKQYKEFLSHIKKIKLLLDNKLNIKKSSYVTITTKEQLLKLPAILEKVSELVFDFEIDTKIDKDISGFSSNDKILGVGFSWKTGNAVFIPLDHKDSPFNNNPELNILAHSTVKKILLNNVPKTAHNLLFDSSVCYHFYNGLKPRNANFDTMLAHHLIDPTQGTHSLKYLITLYTEFGGYEEKLQEIINQYPVEERSYGVVPLDLLANYCMMDCDGAIQLKHIFEKIINDTPSFKKIWEHITLPSHELMFDLKTRGWFIDEKKLTHLEDYYSNRINELNSIIYNNPHIKKYLTKNSTQTFNISSPAQLSELLYKVLRLPAYSQTKKGKPSTDSKTLNILIADTVKNPEVNELLKAIVEYKVVSKLLSTYIIGFKKHINHGQVFTNYLIHGTATARLASRSPNLQNIPAEFDEVLPENKIKSLFIPPPGFNFFSADHSQIELRNLANATNDENLVKAYTEGLDIHKATASIVFGLPLDQVKDSQRKVGKTVNFAAVYGAGAKRLVETLETEAPMSNEEILEILYKINPESNMEITTSSQRSTALNYVATYILKTFYDNYHLIKLWQKVQVQFAESRKYCVSPFGRVRYLHNTMGGLLKFQKASLRNQALNTPIQSVSSDCLMLGMIHVNKVLNRYFKTYLVGQVHDSIIGYVHESEIDTVFPLIKTILEEEPLKFNPEFFKVPFQVEFEIGENWGSLKKIQVENKKIDYINSYEV